MDYILMHEDAEAAYIKDGAVLAEVLDDRELPVGVYRKDMDICFTKIQRSESPPLQPWNKRTLILYGKASAKIKSIILFIYKMRCQMHTVQLILRPTEYEKAVINKRFHAVSHIHNVVFI